MGFFRQNQPLSADVFPEFCNKTKTMQYYKGKALYPEDSPAAETTHTLRNTSFFNRFLKIVVFPFLICFWLVQNVVYKSLEESD